MTKRSFFKDILGVLSSNVFSLILGLLTGIIISRVLGPEGRGVYTSIYVVPLIFLSFGTFGIRRSAVFHIGKKLFKEEDIISTIYFLLLFTSTIAIIGCAIVYYFLDNPDFTLPLVIFAILSIPMRLAIGYTRGIFLGKEQFRYANQMNWLPVAFNLVFVVIFVWLAHLSVLGAILAVLVSSSIVAVFAITVIQRRNKIRIKYLGPIVKSMLRLGFVYSISLFVMQLNYRVDILLLERLSTFTEVGYYSLGVSIAERLWQLPIAMGIVIMSRSANVDNEIKLDKDIARMIRVSFLISLIGAVALFFIAPYIIPLLYGKEFIPSIEILQLILPGILLFIIFRLINSRFAGMGKPELTIYIFTPALILNIVLNYFWIPEYGGLGAAMATNVSYILGTVASVIIYSYTSKMSIIRILAYKKEDFNFVGTLIKRTFIRWKK